MYTVYMHISPSNKRYIGITKQKPRARWRGGEGYKGNPYFYKAIQKYGWDNFEHLIIMSGLTKEDAENLEITLISQYKTTDRDRGYNIENGGNCCGTHSKETRAKIGAKSKGNKACLGRKISKEHIEALRLGRLKKGYVGHKSSEETKRKISAANKGKHFSEEHILHIKEARSRIDFTGPNNPMFGKKQTEETKKKISAKAKGRKCTEEQIQRKKEIAKKRPVYKMNMEGVVLCRYKSIYDAAMDNNAKSQNIGAVCKGVGKSCRGFLWRYADDNT